MRHLILLGAALALPACASVKLPSMSIGKGESAALSRADVGVVAQPPAPDGLDPIAAAAFWGTRYDANPRDAQVAVRFSAALRAVQNDEEALRVIGQAAARGEDDPRVKLELAKALIANDRAHEAVRPAEQAIAGGLHEDWSAYSTYGVALDKIGRHRQARAQYDRALALDADNARVLNNKGLSFALSGDAREAESTLRTAAALPGGSARVRQNLALVLGLSGRTTEAEMLARSDLPPAVASGNVAYFQSLVGQPAYWGNLDRRAAELPDFGDEAVPVSVPVPAPVPSPAPRDEVEPAAPIQGEPAPGVMSMVEGRDVAGAPTPLQGG